MTWDDLEGYETTDPKHPDFLEMWLEFADTCRKREKEDEFFADEPPCSDPRPDPRTHPEYWTE